MHACNYLPFKQTQQLCQMRDGFREKFDYLLCSTNFSIKHLFLTALHHRMETAVATADEQYRQQKLKEFAEYDACPPPQFDPYNIRTDIADIVTYLKSVFLQHDPVKYALFKAMLYNVLDIMQASVHQDITIRKLHFQIDEKKRFLIDDSHSLKTDIDSRFILYNMVHYNMRNQLVMYMSATVNKVFYDPEKHLRVKHVPHAFQLLLAWKFDSHGNEKSPMEVKYHAIEPEPPHNMIGKVCTNRLEQFAKDSPLFPILKRFLTTGPGHNIVKEWVEILRYLRT